MAGQDSVPQYVRLDAGEKLRWTIVVLPGVSCDLSMEIDCSAPGAEVDLAGLYLCPADEKVRLNVLVKHSAPGCVSRQLFKGIVGGKASAHFDGLIYVARGADRTKANQATHSILLSSEARVEGKPQLEIYADDVECSHGATTGFLNPDELFYMRSRGIPEAEARRLQMISFVAPVLGRLPEDMAEDVISKMNL